MSNLAINGGEKVRTKLFPKHPVIGDEEKKQVMEVLDSGNLSTFAASPGENFLGGKKIRQFEETFANKIGTKFAIAFNSASSALHAAIASVGVSPGDEVIVPPYTFTSTATSALMHNAIPVFCDVKRDTYCLNPNNLDTLLTPLTKAIIPVHLFGNAADMDEIMEFAKKNNLLVIEDCAQAPGGQYRNKNLGTIGDCGIFSFQESKNIMTGEGGMLLTDNEDIANVARMVRNHGEVIIPTMKHRTYRSEILGWGYRMTELEAAIGIAQVDKLDFNNNERIKLCSYLASEINKIPGLKHVKYEHVKHVYYVFGFSFDSKKTGFSRNKFCDALNAEGVPCFPGYVKPLYLNPLYLEKRAFAYKHYTGNVIYKEGICPISELLYNEEVVCIMVGRFPSTLEDMNDIIVAIHKIFENKEELN